MPPPGVSASMQSLSRLTLVLCCAWVLTLFYGEMVAYWLPLWTCSWPQHEGDLSFSTSIDGSEVKVAVIADPQLMDRTSLSLAPNSIAFEAAKFYTDLYMRRSFRSSILPFKPNLIIFLGDHFDGGPFLSDQEWLESYSRFKHIFGLGEHGRYSYIRVYYLSGNHDIGYSSSHAQYPEVISRYEKEFGARNYCFLAGKLEFIVVDAQTLDGPKHGKETYLSWQFIKNVSSADMVTPRVLLTHIPLYRPNDSPCGPYRYSGVINQRISYTGPDQGIKYQNYLTKDTSDSLLHLIKPAFVLSGHDHDQCTMMHSTNFGSIVEHTLGTISWQQGNLHPSFMLLTARASNATNIFGNAVSTSLCFLPVQTYIYIWYLCLFFITLLLFSIWPTNGFACFGQFARFISSERSKWSTTMKEKADEEDCEYDTVWDSEGSMHLIKKYKPVPVAYSDGGVTGRGNAMLRSSAKKQPPQEQQETSILVEADMNLDSFGKTRQYRSRLMRLVLRVVRVLRLVILVASINVPLYMMLLFKDWIGH